MATELERRLIERIERDGPITFRDFMNSALYDPELGYYNTERLKIGAEGDYYTSSNVHPAFGGVLAEAFSNLWAGRSEPLTLVEMGAGTGQLAYDVLRAISDVYPALFERLTYVIVETSSAMLKRQQGKLSGFADRIKWSELNELESNPFKGIVFSNELVDAMPVQRVRYKQDVVEVLYVTTSSEAMYGRPSVAAPHSHTTLGEKGAAGDRDSCKGNEKVERLAFQWAEPSDKRLLEYMKRMQTELSEGQILEINLDAIDWLAHIARALESGFLITIDYGDLVEHLWSPDRREGTLRSFHRHRLVDWPLDRIGEQDLTASVNFTALIEYGRDFGLESVSYERQTAFLTRMGLIERIAGRYGPTESLEDLRERLAMKNLFVPAGISDSFRVLIQRKRQQNGN